jgi:hypothetical protein
MFTGTANSFLTVKLRAMSGWVATPSRTLSLRWNRTTESSTKRRPLTTRARYGIVTLNWKAKTKILNLFYSLVNYNKHGFFAAANFSYNLIEMTSEMKLIIT